jgi:lipopolysaccharide/colanic/teichoic acid biosynthesis glycosyltransferase
VIKRFIEAAAAALLLFLLLPVLLGIGIFVRIALGGSVLFRQERTGAKGRLFSLLKFRTMRDALDTEGRPLPDEQRLTGFGRILRASSLDELPELWNVLKGDMSLVGPRPLLPQYLSRYTPEQRRRHEVKPGITGWAQVNGRNSLSWEKRFELDVWYVDNRSLALDLKILWMTLLTVLRRSGVSADGHATMPEFQGTCGTEQPS